MAKRNRARTSSRSASQSDPTHIERSHPTRVSRYRPHPWHGLEVGPDPPEILNAYIEITPFDLMKFEVDKISGYLRVDRPQRSSAQHPSLYGFVPRTYCGPRVCTLAPGAKRGDGDPLDICVLSERAISRNEIIVAARVIGGLQMIDRDEADDKIISVVENDHVWGNARDIDDVPQVFVERLQHYFLTYKLVPQKAVKPRLAEVYGRKHALSVVEAAMADYNETFGT